MNGEFDQARALYRRGRGLLRELGHGLNAASTGVDILLVELLAGDLDAAVREVMPDYEFLVRAGETYYMSTIAALLSRVLRDQGRDDEALVFSTDRRRRHGGRRHGVAGALAFDPGADHCTRRQSGRSGIAGAVGGRTFEEERRAANAGRHLVRTRSSARVGRAAEEAREAIETAIAIYRAKGDVVSAARATAWAKGLS